MSQAEAGKPGPTSVTSQGDRGEAILRLLDRPIPPSDLDAGAAMAAQPAEMRGGRITRILLFRLGEETAGVQARALRRVTPLARAVPIPHRSSGVLRGVCNIRGELVLCADMHRLLGLPERAAVAAGGPDSRRMVVVGPAENSWAFEVDALMGIESVDPAAFRSPPVTVEHAIGDFTLGVTEVGGQSVTVLDAERILAGFKAGLA